MGGKESAGLDFGGNVVRDGPGQAKAVVGRGSPADLVDDHQTFWSCVAQNARCIQHFDHERRIAVKLRITGADSYQNVILKKAQLFLAELFKIYCGNLPLWQHQPSDMAQSFRFE